MNWDTASLLLYSNKFFIELSPHYVVFLTFQHECMVVDSYFLPIVWFPGLIVLVHVHSAGPLVSVFLVLILVHILVIPICGRMFLPMMFAFWLSTMMHGAALIFQPPDSTVFSLEQLFHHCNMLNSEPCLPVEFVSMLRFGHCLVTTGLFFPLGTTLDSQSQRLQIDLILLSSV